MCRLNYLIDWLGALSVIGISVLQAMNLPQLLFHHHTLSRKLAMFTMSVVVLMADIEILKL